MEKRAPHQQGADGSRNLGELRRWAQKKDTATSGAPLPDYYLDMVNRRWRMLGRLARQPASLRNAEHHT